MAPRKPNKSQRGKPSDGLANQVGAWLGGAAKGVVAGPTQLARDYAATLGADAAGAARGVQSWSESQARTFTNPYINAAGRVIGKNPNLPVSGAKEAITNTAFGVVDVAAGPVGRVVAKGAVRAVQSGRVVNPVAAARNLVKGEKVFIHGTPNPLQGKFIEPRAETYGAQDIGKPVVFGFDPRAVKAKSTIPHNVQTYSAQSFFRPDPSDYNAVIGTTPKSSIKTHGPTGYKYSESPVSIDKVVKTNKPPEQLAVELQRELRKMGTQMRGTTIKQAVKDAKKRREIKNRLPQPRT